MKQQMKQQSRKRPSLSLVISLVALVVAMGGTSYAAVKIGTSGIQNGAVTSGKIRNETIGSGDVRDGGLRARDFGGTLPGGPQGPQGPRGLPGVNRWALVGPDGTIAAQSGGFTLVAGYPVLPNTAPGGTPDNSLRANGNVYINANEDLSDNGILATIVLQNTVDQDGGGMAGRTAGADANAEFSGEIAVSRCNVGAPTTPPSGPTNCAPAGAQNTTSFVVSPRLSNGSVTSGVAPAGNRKAFYVIITGDSSDFVAP
jgi:hypothetical protein